MQPSSDHSTKTTHIDRITTRRNRQRRRMGSWSCSRTLEHQTKLKEGVPHQVEGVHQVRRLVGTGKRPCQCKENLNSLQIPTQSLMLLPTIVLTTPSNNPSFLLWGRITVNPRHLSNTTNNNFHHTLIDFFHYHTKTGQANILKNLETPIVNKRLLFTIPKEIQHAKDRCLTKLSTTPKLFWLFTM